MTMSSGVLQAATWRVRRAAPRRVNRDAMTSARLGRTCQVDQPGERCQVAPARRWVRRGRPAGSNGRVGTDSGISKPSPNRPSACREGARERRFVGRDPPPRSPVLPQHQEPPDARRPPSPLACDLARQARLAVDRHEHRLQIRNHRLHLDDKQRHGRRVKREHVDRSTFSPDRERDFRAVYQPAARSHRMTMSTRAACDSSRSRSSASPFHSSRHSIRAPSAPATACSARTVSRSARPRSTREMAVRETPACSARSAWRQRRRRRRARMESPNRTASMLGA